MITPIDGYTNGTILVLFPLPAAIVALPRLYVNHRVNHRRFFARRESSTPPSEAYAKVQRERHGIGGRLAGWPIKTHRQISLNEVGLEEAALNRPTLV
jgi:hypothetical protein